MNLLKSVTVIAIIVAIFAGSFTDVYWVENSGQTLAVGSLTPWLKTTSFPNAAAPSCDAYSGYLYCVSLGSQSVYYADINSSGIGTWSETTQFPVLTSSPPSCVAYAGRIYCVAGSDVFYATINSSGVGTWMTTQSYPSYVIVQNACVVFSGYIYCIGGEEPNRLVNASATDYVYYAQILQNGISSWNETTPYPIADLSLACIESSGYVYCFTGQDVALAGPSCATPSTGACDYYAKLGPSGVSNWRQTADYPFFAELSTCTANFSSVYCVGGIEQSDGKLYSTSLVYNAADNISGIGSWQKSSPYPASSWGDSCVVYSNYVYCVGGESGTVGNGHGINDSYYSEIVSPSMNAALTALSNTSKFDMYALSTIAIALASIVGLLIISRINRERISVNSTNRSNNSTSSARKAFVSMQGTCFAGKLRLTLFKFW